MKDQKIGLIGLGSMGSEMALKFLAAGYDLTVYDIKAERLLPSVSAGATEAGSAADLAKKVDLVMTSLRDSAIWVSVTETELLPHAKLGQTFIDFGTTVVQQTQQLAEALTTKEATLLDVPVSGGPVGIRNGNLHMFAGGCREEFDRCLPLLSVIGDPKRIVYCGPSGSGQVAKGVNQLAMGLGAAAYLEAIAFGVNSCIELDAICQAVGGTSGWRRHFESVAQRVQQGDGNQVYVKFPELHYFLGQAERQGYEIPLTQVLYDFCRRQDFIVPDNMGRDSHPFWHALMSTGQQSDPPEA